MVHWEYESWNSTSSTGKAVPGSRSYTPCVQQMTCVNKKLISTLLTVPFVTSRICGGAAPLHCKTMGKLNNAIMYTLKSMMIYSVLKPYFSILIGQTLLINFFTWWKSQIHINALIIIHFYSSNLHGDSHSSHWYCQVFCEKKFI